MTRRSIRPVPAGAFDRVKAVGLGLPDVEASIRYDGAPVLLVGEAVARAITGTTIDCEDDGSRLVIKRGGTAA